MSVITCEDALALAGRPQLSGEVLAARWHVYNCPRCQRMLDELWIQVVALDDRLALEKLLGIDLTDAVCRQKGRIITWLAKGSSQVVATVIRLTGPPTPLPEAGKLATLGEPNALTQRVIRQDVEESADGSVRGKITFIVNLAEPEVCEAEIEVDAYDRWDLSGIDVLLIWEGDERRGQTDERGQVRLSSIPIDALGQISVIIHLPQAPNVTNGAQ